VPYPSVPRHKITKNSFEVYSNGISEIILGKAIKKHNLPRDEIVVMTKVWLVIPVPDVDTHFSKVRWPVGKEPSIKLFDNGAADEAGYANQYGLSRKVEFVL